MGAALSPARRYCAHMVTAADAGNFPVFHHKRQIYSCSRAVRLKMGWSIEDLAVCGWKITDKSFVEWKTFMSGRSPRNFELHWLGGGFKDVTHETTRPIDKKIMQSNKSGEFIGNWIREYKTRARESAVEGETRSIDVLSAHECLSISFSYDISFAIYLATASWLRGGGKASNSRWAQQRLPKIHFQNALLSSASKRIRIRNVTEPESQEAWREQFSKRRRHKFPPNTLI